jgi:ATP-dependent DNA ligase
MRAFDDEVALTVAQLYFIHMLQRTLPAGFIAPCLPTKAATLPSGSDWLHEIKSGIRFNEHMEGDGPTVFAHACKLGLEGIVSKRKDSAYRSGRSPDWLKMKNPAAPAVNREAEEDWGRVFQEKSNISPA